ncbi:MAG: hypothetical protein H7Y07_14870 [Pyrinomonadaceae bacterium]|nr:hypothetical protein [Sphingobacteriaceae bacterium]
MKQLNVNYYDAGKALGQLVLAGLIIKDEGRENCNIKSLCVERIRYRMSLAGEMFVDEFLSHLRTL